MDDLAVIIVSYNSREYLGPCLESVYEHAGEAGIEVFVVDNDSSDGSGAFVESTFPEAQVIRSPNRGFGYGNNRGIERARARYLLMLNPDTQIVEGTFGELVRLLDERPDIGLAGVRQVRADGVLSPTMRRFPSVTRALGEALFSERWPIHPAWAGERILDVALYEREQECDWTSGSFMIARREALLSAGLFDERFFLFSEEPDLCLRIKRAGWGVRHLPQMTILHHAGKDGVRPRWIAQDAFTRRQYAHKHFPARQRRNYITAWRLNFMIRAAGAHGASGRARREGALLALRALSARATPPFEAPRAVAMCPAVRRSEDIDGPVMNGAETDLRRA